MKCHIPGLHREGRNGDDIVEGVFLVRVDHAFYRWHPQRPFYVLRFAILEPKEHQGHSFTGRLYCTATRRATASECDQARGVCSHGMQPSMVSSSVTFDHVPSGHGWQVTSDGSCAR